MPTPDTVHLALPGGVAVDAWYELTARIEQLESFEPSDERIATLNALQAVADALVAAGVGPSDAWPRDAQGNPVEPSGR